MSSLLLFQTPTAFLQWPQQWPRCRQHLSAFLGLSGERKQRNQEGCSSRDAGTGSLNSSCRPSPTGNSLGRRGHSPFIPALPSSCPMPESLEELREHWLPSAVGTQGCLSASGVRLSAKNGRGSWLPKWKYGELGIQES